MSASSRPLGRNVPWDRTHIECFPLSEAAGHVGVLPMTLGINWYTSFDTPVPQDGLPYGATHTLLDVSTGGQLGTVRGGHDICCEPNDPDMKDIPAWVTFYNQLQTPACEGFAHARMMSLIYRKAFDPLWIYNDARRVEGTFPSGEGSTNRAADKALQMWGAHPVPTLPPGPAVEQPWQPNDPGGQPQTIKTYRWATTADEVLATLGDTAGYGAVLLQSWGPTDYPQRVLLPAATLEELLQQGGEAEVITED